MPDPIYRTLAQRLDSLPNGFPPTEDGVELRLLAHLFTPEDAALACELGPTSKRPTRSPLVWARAAPPHGPADRHGEARADQGRPHPRRLGLWLAAVRRRHLRDAGSDHRFRARPAIRAVLPAGLRARHDGCALRAPGHPGRPSSARRHGDRTVRKCDGASSRPTRPGRSIDCICRKQKALIGDPCDHPLDVCLSLSTTPGVFDRIAGMKVLTKEEALDTLRRSAEAGLVHSVSNNQEGLTYICNCCTCSCGILRGIAEFGMANAVARSAFVNTVDADLCLGCGLCEGRVPVRGPGGRCDRHRQRFPLPRLRCLRARLPGGRARPRPTAGGRGPTASGHRGGLARGTRAAARAGRPGTPTRLSAWSVEAKLI